LPDLESCFARVSDFVAIPYEGTESGLRVPPGPFKGQEGRVGGEDDLCTACGAVLAPYDTGLEMGNLCQLTCSTSRKACFRISRMGRADYSLLTHPATTFSLYENQ
jgi:hypothetical protein